MGNKVIELSEKEQRNLFCAAWHLTNLVEDAKEDLPADLGTPCENCKYQQECYKEDGFDMYAHFNTLTKLTGVKFSEWKGARKNGVFNLLEGVNNE